MKTTTIKNENDFTVNVEEYMKPERDVNLCLVLNMLDRMDLTIGHEDVHINEISAKLLVSDIACYCIYGQDKLLDKFLANRTFKKAMKEENAEFIAAVAIYTQWAGSLNKALTDVYYSVHNAIKDYVSANWAEANRKPFWSLID